MTFEERSDLVLALARTLYVNGQSTDQTLAAAVVMTVAASAPCMNSRRSGWFA